MFVFPLKNLMDFVQIVFLCLNKHHHGPIFCVFVVLNVPLLKEINKTGSLDPMKSSLLKNKIKCINFQCTSFY